MVKLVQLLCPQRHCLLASAYEEGLSNYGEVTATLEALLQPTGAFNRHCAICGSTELHFEEATTEFKTLKDAAPSLGQGMADQMATRAALDAAGLTYDKRKLN